MSGEPEPRMCVRHGKVRRDSKLRHFFLCRKCADIWSKDAFHGNRPVFELDLPSRTRGYCGLCNSNRAVVRMRSWFLCNICDRVARSIGRNHVAEAAIVKFWQEYVTPKHPELKLVRNDKSALRPIDPHHIAGISAIDFLIQDVESDSLVFAIENKTGRSALRQMRVFQLDVSDCDCIANEMERLKIPAYIIHAQVLEEYLGPTVGYSVVNMWWTDVYEMRKYFKSTGCPGRC